MDYSPDFLEQRKKASSENFDRKSGLGMGLNDHDVFKAGAEFIKRRDKISSFNTSSNLSSFPRKLLRLQNSLVTSEKELSKDHIPVSRILSGEIQYEQKDAILYLFNLDLIVVMAIVFLIFIIVFELT